MAFDRTRMTLVAHGARQKIYAYLSAADAMAAILGANYFDAFAGQTGVGDLVVVQDSANLVAIVRVSARTETGVTLGPVTGWAPQAAIGALTDSSGGTADGTIAAVSGSGADAAINNNFADLAAKVNAIRAALVALGAVAAA